MIFSTNHNFHFFFTKILSQMNFISKLVSILEVTLKDSNGLTTEPQEYLRQQPTELFRFYSDHKQNLLFHHHEYSAYHQSNFK